MPVAEKPSFLTSVISGIKGYSKGFFAGAGIGIVTGALIGAALGALTGGLALAPILSTAMLGAAFLGSSMAAAGALAGGVTGVIKSRETASPSAQDITNLANMAFTQGFEAGVTQERETTVHRDRLAKQEVSVPGPSDGRVH